MATYDINKFTFEGDTYNFKDDVSGYLEENVQYHEDSTPYSYRPTGGAPGSGDREYLNAIVGGTVAWNQECDNSTDWRGGTTSYDSATNTTTVECNNSSYAYRYKATVQNHVYYFGGYIKCTEGGTIRTALSRGWIYEDDTVTANQEKLIAHIFKPTASSDSSKFSPQIKHTTATDYTLYIRNYSIVDLTALFGSSTIADYLYSLEQTTAGSGVAKLKEWGFDIDSYHAYDAGSLQSVNVSAHETVGFNQWDEEWEVGQIEADGTISTPDATRRTTSFIPVIPNATYFMSNVNCMSGRYAYYDANKNCIVADINGFNSQQITVPNNAHYLRITLYRDYGTTYNNDICINISSDRNGEYEPYAKHSYSLDSDLTLRGIPKLDSSNKLYYDGDVYEPSGSVTRKYGIVDLGTLNWIYDTYSNQHLRVMGQHMSQMPKFQGNLMCPKFIGTKKDYRTIENLEMCVDNSAESPIFRIRDDSFTDAASFKSAMSGVYLVYELATPTTETADPYTAIQDVSPYGTEEYIDYGVSQGTRDIAVPVGHETKYFFLANRAVKDVLINGQSLVDENQVANLDYVGAIRVTTPSFSSLPQTYANSRMTSSHLLINTVLSNPSAQTSDWVITTNNGSITIDGTTSGEGISGSTTATFDFVLGV